MPPPPAEGEEAEAVHETPKGLGEDFSIEHVKFVLNETQLTTVVTTADFAKILIE